MHYERRVAANRIEAACIGTRSIRRRGGRLEIGNIETGPGFLFLIPPDQFLALRPRTPFGIGGCAVVHYSAIGRPRVCPIRIYPPILESRDAWTRAIFPARINAAVWPHSAPRRAVVFEIAETR